MVTQISTRYFILIHQDKEYLKEVKEKIEQELNDVYKLKLNKNKTNITTSKEGFIFLGYRFRVINNKTIINISNSTLKRVKKRIKEVKYLYDNDKITFNSTFSSINNYYYSFKTLKIKKLVDKYFFTNQVNLYIVNTPHASNSNNVFNLNSSGYANNNNANNTNNGVRPAD